MFIQLKATWAEWLICSAIGSAKSGAEEKKAMHALKKKMSKIKVDEDRNAWDYSVLGVLTAAAQFMIENPHAEPIP